MPPPRAQFDPYRSDPARWGFSLAQMSELLLPCLDAAGAKSVAEIGAFAGDLTRVLVEWAAGAGAHVLAIDPAPEPALRELDRSSQELELVRKTSLEALAEIPLPDAIVIDGDHNYYTVSEELRVIGERAKDAALPLLLFHDVSWPHARRDDYFDAAAIPEDARHPVAGLAGGLVPGEPGVVPGALPYPRSAAREGGARNGVLTAVEDFVAGWDGLRLVVVPAFFGFGVVWDLSSPWSKDLEALLDPFDSNPILLRLEANRVHHLAQEHIHQSELWKLQARLGRQQAILERLLRSSAFSVAERLSGLRVRAGIAPGDSGVTREDIRRALEE